MRGSRCAALLPCHSAFAVRDTLWVVVPTMHKGSAVRAMRRISNRGGTAGPDVEGPGLPERWVAAIMRSMLVALQYLHAAGTLHRDIKGGNVLLDGKMGPMLADFGVSQWLREPVAEAYKRKTRTLVGTTCFIAPEVLDTASGYNSKVDIWSLGITSLELAMGRAPYSELESEEVLVKLLTK